MNFGSLAQLSQAALLENLTGAGFCCSLAQEWGQVGTQHLSLHLDTDFARQDTKNWLSLNLLYIGTPAPPSLSVFFVI